MKKNTVLPKTKIRLSFIQANWSFPLRLCLCVPNPGSVNMSHRDYHSPWDMEPPVEDANVAAATSQAAIQQQDQEDYDSDSMLSEVSLESSASQAEPLPAKTPFQPRPLDWPEDGSPKEKAKALNSDDEDDEDDEDPSQHDGSEKGKASVKPSSPLDDFFPSGKAPTNIRSWRDFVLTPLPMSPSDLLKKELEACQHFQDTMSQHEDADSKKRSLDDILNDLDATFADDEVNQRTAADPEAATVDDHQQQPTKRQRIEAAGGV